jgi:hypothetical protein
MAMITSQKKSLSVGKYVDNQHVDTVIRTYKQERWAHNSDRIGKEDSLSAWYSVEELENFIEVAKQNGADGVRIYFAAYPENFTEVPAYAGRQTVVLVGTKRKMSSRGTEVDKDIYLQTDKGSQILAYNMSFICPPICQGGGKGEGTSIPDLGEGLGITIVDRKDQGLVVI